MPPSEEGTAGDFQTDPVRCPTCGAVQAWSDTCRRCRSDLRLLRAVHEAYQQTRLACLARLRTGEHRSALRLARRCHELSASSDSARLLAVCALLAGDWPSAASLGRRRKPE